MNQQPYFSFAIGSFIPTVDVAVESQRGAEVPEHTGPVTRAKSFAEVVTLSVLTAVASVFPCHEANAGRGAWAIHADEFGSAQRSTAQTSAALEDWPTPSELAITEMRSNPARLIGWIESGQLGTGYLSLAAEALGEVDSPRTKSVLMQLLAHEAPVVREGAIYGMANLGITDLKQVLRAIADNDQSPGVRAAALELLGA